MRKRGKVKIVLTVFIIVLFSCTAVIGNSRTGVIENVMAKNACDGRYSDRLNQEYSQGRRSLKHG